MSRVKLLSFVIVGVGLAAWFTGIFYVPGPHNVGLVLLSNWVTGVGVGLLLRDPLARLFSIWSNRTSGTQGDPSDLFRPAP